MQCLNYLCKIFYLDLYYVFYKLLFTSCVWFKKPKPPFPPKKPNQTKKGNKTSTHKNPTKKPRTKTPQNFQHHLPLLQSLFLATRIFYALRTTESSSWLSLFRLSESTFLRKHADGCSTSSKAKGFYPILKVISCVTGTVLIFFFLWNTEMLCLKWLLAEKKKGKQMYIWYTRFQAPPLFSVLPFRCIPVLSLSIIRVLVMPQSYPLPHPSKTNRSGV